MPIFVVKALTAQFTRMRLETTFMTEWVSPAPKQKKFPFSFNSFYFIFTTTAAITAAFLFIYFVVYILFHYLKYYAHERIEKILLIPTSAKTTKILKKKNYLKTKSFWNFTGSLRFTYTYVSWKWVRNVNKHTYILQSAAALLFLYLQ